MGGEPTQASPEDASVSPAGVEPRATTCPGGRPLQPNPYVLGVMNPEKMLKTPWGSVYEQVTSELGSKPGIP